MVIEFNSKKQEYPSQRQPALVVVLISDDVSSAWRRLPQPRNKTHEGEGWTAKRHKHDSTADD